MGFLSVLSMAHKLVAERVSPGDTVVDATCGNGVDTQFLAELVGPRGLVYAFDIQERALERTRQRLAEALGGVNVQPPNLCLVQDSHAAMASHVAAGTHGRLAAAMFNLGYLPGADPALITKTESTLEALEAAQSLLRPGGIMTIVLYPGHSGGELEASAVEDWAASLPQSNGQAILYRFAQKQDAPFLIAVEKRQPRHT
ncbi:methyltransferase domain-containing protein [Paenibacillus sp. sptzw28]|uniref:class I SAM-dependent methyltransferase n=1 Tax=Paenibacillus sp. sptzw28 TaxID=715179 RepID=UPI001C6DF468|nr:class I SAM-dependent methyltransferase [Paenibacillus sp. sptzw28]QYR22832.1 methyltransferase domain-containing protein [Paenibacillus sp. sptzw28]